MDERRKVAAGAQLGHCLSIGCRLAFHSLEIDDGGRLL